MSELVTKIGNKNYRVDLTNNRIDFLDTRFYLHSSGNYYPSATTILDAYPKGAGFYEWLKKAGEDADEIRDEAGNEGSTVHRLTEAYDLGHEVSLFDTNGNINVKMIEWAMVERYIEFRNRFNPIIEHIELHMVNPLLQFGGTLDRTIILNGKRYRIDIKTGNGIYNHFWLQLAAYDKLCVAEGHPPADDIAILWLNAKTKTDGRKDAIQGKGWQMLFPEYSIDHYWKLFQAVHQLWLAENRNLQPRQFSYQLSHQIKQAI